MARLNEPPPAPAATAAFAQPTESVDALKRRFVRQNRELAKNNSNQSLRIRSLEIDVSRLLADNLELREQNLQLQGEVDNARAQASNDVVERVKDDLQAKIAELSVLVQGIDALKDEGTRRESFVRERPQTLGQWRDRQTLVDVMRDNQMPTITEDKSYPRRTLGTDEIQAIRLSGHSSNESPDLGPPPIAHFDYEDPVKQMSPTADRITSATLDEDLPADLSMNLETRRKRKDGQPKLEIRRHSITAQSPSKSDSEQPTMLRTGAKRKLADREIESATKDTAKDDFTFSRRFMQTGVTPFVDAPSEEQTEERPEEIAVLAKPARKVLGDKSTNMSPKKVSARTGKPGKDADEKEKEKPKPERNVSRGQARSRRISSIPMPTPADDDIVSTVEIAPPSEPMLHDLPPKTPAALDMFSPTTSEPSSRTMESRDDTPPPANLSTNTADGARPSRRARAAVNYAEPSLVAKMRRPGKQMTDAITGLQDPRRAMSTSTGKKSSRTVMEVKQELEDEDAHSVWTTLPTTTTSPLNTKSTTLLPTHSTSAMSLPGSDVQVLDPKPTTSSKAIATLLAPNRNRRESAKLAPLGTDMVDATARKMQEFDLYDFKDSSSPTSESGMSKPALAKPHRRHSSVPKNVRIDAPPSAEKPVVAVMAKEAPAVVGVGRSERAASRRRSMML